MLDRTVPEVLGRAAAQCVPPTSIVVDVSVVVTTLRSAGWRRRGALTGQHGGMSTDIAPPAVDYERKGRELIEEGFCVLEGMLDAGTLRHTRRRRHGGGRRADRGAVGGHAVAGDADQTRMTIRGWRSVSATPGRWPRWRRWGSAAAGSGRR